MTSAGSFKPKFEIRSIGLIALILTAALGAAPQSSLADEGGVSYWLPGRFGILAAAPTAPGFSMSDAA